MLVKNQKRLIKCLEYSEKRNKWNKNNWYKWKRQNNKVHFNVKSQSATSITVICSNDKKNFGGIQMGYNRDLRCTKEYIKHRFVRITSAGVEQAGMLLLSQSAAFQNHDVYLSF